MEDLGRQKSWRDAYEVTGELGEGGVARVYSARHRENGRYVAIKVMRQELLQKAEVRERFRREAIAIREIDSPHVCSVYDFDTEGDEVYMVMEFVEGVTLRKIIRSAPWSVADVSVVIGQVGEALYAAHKKGIVHRDLKPENIVLTGEGLARQVKVLDFGFAKLIEAERSASIEKLTQTGSVFGTPQYMSPEQIMGKEVTGQSDLFALAIIAYEIIAGRRPWGGGAPHEVMLAVASQPPPAIKQARCNLGQRKAQLEAFFARALDKKPDGRFADAHEMCGALDKALGVEVSSSREDPRGWFEELSHATLFDIPPIAASEIFGEDTDVTSPEDIDRDLPSTWHNSVLAKDPSLSADTLDDVSEDEQTVLHTPVYKMEARASSRAEIFLDPDPEFDKRETAPRRAERPAAHLTAPPAQQSTARLRPERKEPAPAPAPPSTSSSGRLLMLALGVIVGAAIATALSMFFGR